MSNNKELNNDTITFGKYKNSVLQDVLKDRSYCKWLLNQEWFQTSYEYLYNRVNEYDPKIYFQNPVEVERDFISSYIYFNLTSCDKLQLELNEKEQICYIYYLKMISELKEKIQNRIENREVNPFNIKAPVNWLKRFEKETDITREEFKEFINSYELPNIPYIMKDIKKEGGIEYKGGDSFKIAKKRSVEQELWWEDILKSKYGEDISIQFKYENCVFDFLDISTETIFECKLNLENFDEKQYQKYITILDRYNIVYLFSRDCVVNMANKKIYTTDLPKYSVLIPSLCSSNKLAEIIFQYEIVEVDNIEKMI